MTRSTRTTARRRAAAVLTVGATLAGAGALLGPGTSSASSHREAPFVANDPAIDNTDVYAFTSPDKPDTATVIANWAPFSEPAGGPNFFPWATDAAYDVNIDNNGDAKPDLVYRWTFSNVDKRGTTKHGDEVGGTFLYNDGPVTSLTDDNLLFRQTYDMDVIAYDANGAVTATTPLLNDVPVAPSNVGKASMPNYGALRAQAVAAGQIAGGAGGQSYVGQADDPFFLDLRVFDLLYGGDFSEAGFDTLKNFNVNTIALQVPKTALAGGGSVSDNPVVGVWSTTSRYATRTLKATNEAPGAQTAGPATDDAVKSNTGALAQVSRLGAPLVNEVVVPAQLKDYFNRSTPDKDAQFLKKVTDPELPYLIEGIYKVPNPNKTPKGANRPDLVQAFLTGVPGINATSVNKNNANPAPAEYLRLNLGTPVTAKPNRLGAVGGDVQGFPNGRRLTDDVIDIALQVVEGVLVSDQDPAVKKAVSGLGDGVNANDKRFLGSFPYIADPWSGSDPHVGQLPLSFKQRLESDRPGSLVTGVSSISPAQPGSTAILYRVNANGTTQPLVTRDLSADGTSVPTFRLSIARNSNVTLFWRVFANKASAAGTNSGVPTLVRIR